MNKRLRRTVMNWRWWVVLPLLPFFLLIMLLHDALATSLDGVMRALSWVRAGART